MASRPYVEKRNGKPTGRWVCKYKPDPTGPWVVVGLGRDPRLTGARPPKTPPQPVIDRHRGFEEVEYNARHGIRPAPARARPLAGYVADYLDAFAASHKPGSVRQAKRHAERFVAFAAARGVTTVQGVSQGLCRDYLAHRIATVGHDTLRTTVGYLKPVWSHAVQDGLTTRNPWAGVKVPGKSTRSAPVFWSPAEVARIAAACGKAWQTDLVLVLVNTGLRISTALALRWDWFDWKAGLIEIPAAVAAKKEGVKTAYRCALNRVSRDVLTRRRFASRDDLVFPNPYRGGGEIPYDSAREAIARAIGKAGVKPGTPHDLRHTCARLMERAGAPWSIVQAQLGHSAISTTQRYADADATEAVRWLEGFGIGDVKNPSDPSPGPA